MPELPEVETICQTLKEVLPGRMIARVEVREARLRCRVPDDFPRALKGRTFTDIKRRGKYLLISLDRGLVWIVHLGMSGKLIHVGRSRPRRPHDHIIVTLDNGNELRYHDPRRFGFSYVVPERAVYGIPQISRLGLEPLGADFHDGYLYTLAKRSRRKIKDFLMDQRVVVGLGNIYSSEILFHAGIRPTRQACKVGRPGIRRIAEAIPRVLQKAISLRGTSFSDYRDGQDRKGEFQKYLQVYGRNGEGCRVCDGSIKGARVGSRSGFYCPGCQR